MIMLEVAAAVAEEVKEVQEEKTIYIACQYADDYYDDLVSSRWWSWSSSLCEIIIVINAITFINIYALIGNSPRHLFPSHIPIQPNLIAVLRLLICSPPFLIPSTLPMDSAAKKA